MRNHTVAATLALIAACLTGGCDVRSPIRAAQASAADSIAGVETARTRRDSIVRARPGYVVDSILPVQEEIRRFQATLGSRPTRFAHGATSRAGLVAAFVQAVERNDAKAVGRLVVDRAEFGYLVYPTSPNAAPPYRQSPQVVWLTRTAATEKSAARLLARFGGRSLSYAGFSCTGAERQGTNRVWRECAVKRVGEAGDTIRLRMFGSIIEREGRFKFLSLANGL